jgi:methyl-accepting chemotaxis protein
MKDNLSWFNKIIGNLKIRTKFFLFFLVFFSFISILSMLAIGLSVDRILREELLNRVLLATRSLAANLADPLLSGDSGRVVDLIFNEKYSRKDIEYVVIFDKDNQILASTLGNEKSLKVATLNNLSTQQDNSIKLIKDGKKIISDEAGEGNIYDVALGLRYDKGVLRVGYNEKYITDAVLRIISFLILILVGSIFIVLFLAFFFANLITQPISQLRNLIVRITEGNLKERITTTSKDEIGDLTRAFNKMLDNIEEKQLELKSAEGKAEQRAGELEILKNNLEKIVGERTKELSAKVFELEKFMELTVGRELKMSELKEKIEKFEKEKK